MRPIIRPGRGRLYKGEFLDFLLDPEIFYHTAPRNKKLYKNKKDGVHQHVEETEAFIRTLWLTDNKGNLYPISPDILISFLDDLYSKKIILPEDTNYDKGKNMSEGTYKSYRANLNNAYRYFYKYKYKNNKIQVKEI